MQYVPCQRFWSKSRGNMPDVPCHQFRSNSHQKSCARCAVLRASKQKVGKNVVPDVPCSGLRSKSGQKCCARCAVFRASKQTSAIMLCQMCRAPGLGAKGHTKLRKMCRARGFGANVGEICQTCRATGVGATAIKKSCAKCAVLRASKQKWAKMLCQMCRAPGFEAKVGKNVVPDVPCSGPRSKRQQ